MDIRLSKELDRLDLIEPRLVRPCSPRRARPIMSSNDNISKPFESVPKLSGKENYVTWKQRLTLALILTRSNSFIDPNTKVPADDSLDTWTDRDSQVAAAILSTTSESILSAHIDHLNDYTAELPRSRVIFKALEKLYGTSGPQYSSPI